MGQIWDRITRIAKSRMGNSIGTSAAERIIRSDDDDLRRIIEDLTAGKKNNENGGNAGSQNRDENVMTVATATAILGVAHDALPEQIKSAYRKKLLDVHPDRVLKLTKEEQESARVKTLSYNAAYEFLRQVKNF